MLRVGKRNREALYTQAPEILSLQQKRDEFLGLIYSFQWQNFARPAENRSGPQTFVIDLDRVKQVTLDAALVLTAEYHRLLIIHKNVDPVIYDRDWDPEVRALFDELGLLKLVKAVDRTGGPVSVGNSGLKFVPFACGQLVEQKQARQLIERLKDIGGQTPEREAVYAALVEAIGNVRSHAYPGGDDGGVVPSVSRWWAAGAYDPDQETLQFAVYDQGVGIPQTLPKQGFWQSVLRFCPQERTDADVIAGAIRYGRSRFRAKVALSLTQDDDVSAVSAGRGNGLWAICHFIPQLPGSSVRIMSGCGEVVFDGSRQPTRLNHDTPFCGTLVQWNLKLPRSRMPGELA